MEVLLFEIRGASVKFSTILKRHKDTREKELLNFIEVSESCLSNNPHCTDHCNRDNLDYWKSELQEIPVRESKLKGHLVHARIDWLQLGEKPTKFFCSLERKNYIQKTIRKVETVNGQIIAQAEILKEIETFYSNLETFKYLILILNKFSKIKI